MPTIEEMKNELKYYNGMICNLRAKKSELEQKIQDYNRLIDFTESQIRKKESEEDVNII